jgi:hypothetical protein
MKRILRMFNYFIYIRFIYSFLPIYYALTVNIFNLFLFISYIFIITYSIGININKIIIKLTVFVFPIHPKVQNLQKENKKKR